MKRALVVVLLCLLAGAVINVLVAWSCTIWIPAPVQYISRVSNDVPARWCIDTGTPDEVFAAHGFFCSEFQLQGPETDPNGFEFWVTNASTSGIPFRSFESWASSVQPTNTTTRYGVITIPNAIRPVWYMRLWGENAIFASVLDARVRRVGFVGNSAFYAVVVALIWLAIRRHLHRRRIRQGRCPACGYEVAGLDTCPECGTTVSFAEDS